MLRTMPSAANWPDGDRAAWQLAFEIDIVGMQPSPRNHTDPPCAGRSASTPNFSPWRGIGSRGLFYAISSRKIPDLNVASEARGNRREMPDRLQRERTCLRRSLR